ncbi:GNAT family N-acetyltransferase [Streptomyces sp. NBS 14/10]|uniref:GNAT family N-acetyltransferase n=1 Tax=Streptomyces sp. NBS 14/10 TaxID=1945643 RepID=UPI000B7CDD55|nr:GNAT family N-acetyltransferase [Streptomyces sp. NBS 14/10]KAK1179956.1 GNAT family N-acetyltransferase [Streptomyces sp. NBS 14/10]
MTVSETIAVEYMDGSAAAQTEAEFRFVYAEVFAEEPYAETPESVDANFRRFRSQVRKATFRGALARTADGEPVGIAYGYPLSPSTGWWDRLTMPVSDELRREDGRRTFGLMELAVRAAWRRLGVARRLHEAVLADTSTERVLLNARPDAEAAQAAYRSWGYRKVGEAHPWDGADLHDVMVLDLRAGG